MSAYRRPVFINQKSERLDANAARKNGVQDFHRKIPGYQPTRLVSLPDIATEFGVKAVYVKDESDRFGLPAFKVLGASWGIITAVTSKLGLSTDEDWQTIAARAKEQSIRLVAATDGNHGRAVARIARFLSLATTIYVPASMTEATRQFIAEEGATVIISSDYDTAVNVAAAASDADGAILIQDTAFPGYEEIPSRIVEGYSTMLHEIDGQLQDSGHDCGLVISPVGVGSLAEAVTRHYKSYDRCTKVVTVEADTAACLYKSLRAEKPESIHTSDTIMAGMNCGTVSHSAWPILSRAVDASITVSDFEAHGAVLDLVKKEISAGPCGASGLAAFKYLATNHREALGINSDLVVVLLNTEGKQQYQTPHDVSSDDPVVITQILTRIRSTNPTLSNEEGSGEAEIANYVEAWLQHRNIESHRVESQHGRPSVIGIARGIGGGKSLMINGHTDTVSISKYIPDVDPLSGDMVERDGRQVIMGRGCMDMKAGVAAGMTAVAWASQRKLQGDVLLAAVSDEEHLSIGTQDVLAAGWRSDAAIVTEPTGLNLGTGHKGFVWIDIEIEGISAHGSLPEAGVDAIMNSRKFLNALHEYAQNLPVNDLLGKASLHCGLIEGGVEPSTYPAWCKVTVEFRTVPGQTPEKIVEDLSLMLKQIAANDPTFTFREPRATLIRAAHELPTDHSFTQLTSEVAAAVLEKPMAAQGLGFWCDAALLGEAGIPSLIFGPSGDGLHGKEEWVDVDSIGKTKTVLENVISRFCS